MSKINKGELSERAITNMANMSASILRNIVSSTFGVKANHVRLSGEIPADWIGSFSTNVAYMDVRDDVEELYSWTPETGFKLVEGCYTGSHFYNGNHDRDVTIGNPLHECVDGTEVFFVLVHKLDNYIDYVTVFKAPNFAQKWAEIETEDTVRWEQWITE